jgi:phosphonate degradation associated HDIG domain protein
MAKTSVTHDGVEQYTVTVETPPLPSWKFREGAIMDNLRPANHNPTTLEILELFQQRGNSQYGQEAISQQEHALQAALMAERAGSSPALIAAALLHDLGHLLHNLPENAPDHGVDDHHEALAARWLQRRFGPEVTDPVRLHVAAKRYLCTVEPEYFQQLSPPSITSLELQGGSMTDDELRNFRAEPHFEAAVMLRRWDDTAKVPGLPTPPIEHFAKYVDQTDLAAGPGM